MATADYDAIDRDRLEGALNELSVLKHSLLFEHKLKEQLSGQLTALKIQCNEFEAFVNMLHPGTMHEFFNHQRAKERMRI